MLKKIKNTAGMQIGNDVLVNENKTVNGNKGGIEIAGNTLPRRRI